MTVVQRDVVFSLGSNLGDSLARLQAAVDALGRVAGLTLTAVSAVYLTKPVDYLLQPDFHNIVVLGRSASSPLELLAQANRIDPVARHKLGMTYPAAAAVVAVRPQPATPPISSCQ